MELDKLGIPESGNADNPKKIVLCYRARIAAEGVDAATVTWLGSFSFHERETL
jgi:hypothetical protein